MPADTTSTKKRRRPLEATPANFPCGATARKHVRLAFRNSTDACTTIIRYQRDNGLHAQFARAFGTVPVHESVAGVNNDVEGDTTIANYNLNDHKDTVDSNKGGDEDLVVEPFDPSPALDFLSHLDVSHHEVHVRVASALRSAIEDEIQRITGPGGNPALLELLKSAWQFRDVPELRPILVCVLRRLGDRIPVLMLRRLGAKKAHTLELKNADLVGQLGPHIQRLVWEADLDAARSESSSIDTGRLTLDGSTILADLIRSSVNDYVTDLSLIRAADHAFVGSVAERRYATKSRRSKDSSKAASSSVVEARSTLASMKLTKVIAAPTTTLSDSAGECNSADAISSIKETVGNRPTLLGAVLDMLVSSHASSGGLMMVGATNLTCSLVADILLSFGQLPRSYEVLDILARLLDSAVQVGSISDTTISQIQGCLRTIFRPTRSEQSDRMSYGGTKIKLSLKPVPKPPTSTFPDMVDDSEYQRKLIQKLVKNALISLRENDTQGLFLDPVTDEIAPGYYNIVEKSMCICTMEEKVYTSIDDCNKDTLLIFSNCCKYNIGPAGQWFRSEAERQNKIWKEDTFPEIKSKYKVELTKRKNVLKGRSKPPAPLAFAPGNTSIKVSVAGERMNEAKDDKAINNLTAHDVKPLPPWKCKRRNTESDIPSVQCLASMLLADPFVMKLLIDKILRILRVDVLKSKTLPSGHPLLLSLFQLLNIARISTQLCTLHGPQYHIPDVGIRQVLHDGEDFSPSYELTRNHLPLFAKLLLDTELDRRMVVGGDLHDAYLQNILSRPAIQTKEWERISSLYDLRAVVEAAFIHIIQPGNTNELALQHQFPRFLAALDAMLSESVLHERPFFTSLSHALLRYKTKLPNSIRDLVTGYLLRWLRVGGDISPSIALCSSLHECFINLLNEWSTFGNVVLPRDKLLSLCEEAVIAASGNHADNYFSDIWASDNVRFLAVKEQYMQILSIIPDTRALQWKIKVGINTPSLNEIKADDMQEDF